jgi:hypothetical protein
VTSLAEAAAFLAQQWPVFPCGADKRPVTLHGFKDAVTDPEAARRLFRAPGAALIGTPTGAVSNLAVVDLDLKEGGSGLEWLAANQHRMPRTRRHQTRSGGAHLLFNFPAGRRIRNSASKIAPGVDVRGDGGYIIVPPSDGYTIADDAMPVDMPAWLLDLIDPPEAPRASPVAPAPRPTNGDGTAYGLAALERECRAVANASPGTQEVTLNAAGLKLGALIAGGELARGVALQSLITAGHQMATGAGERPWSAEEIRSKVHRAVTDGGASPRQAPPREVRHTVRVEIVPPEAPWPDQPPEHWLAEPDMAMDAGERPAPTDGAHLRQPPAGFPTLSIDEILALPPPEWLVVGLLTVESNALLAGPYASLKSFLALDLSLCIAYGRPWQERQVRQTGVLYIAGEGVRGLGRRIRAWQIHHGMEAIDAPFRLLSAGVNITDPEHVAKLIASGTEAAAKEGQAIGLIVIDTLARAMVGADENSAQDMGRAVRATDDLRESLRATTLTVCHTGKDRERGTRGSSALPGAADTILSVEREEERLTITIEKQKDDEEGEPIILKALKVALDGGEVVDDAPTSLVLVGDEAAGSASVRPSGRLSGDQQQALKVLHDALAECGEPGFAGVPSGLVSIPEDWWRDRYYQRCKPGADQAAKQKSFRRAADRLLEAGRIAANRGRIWAI